MTPHFNLEADLKRWIVDQFKDAGGYGRRIEEMYNVGFPDLILELPGFPVFFTEAKLIKGVTFGPSPRQFVELGRLAITKHSFPTILGWRNGACYLHKYAELCLPSDCVMQRDGEMVTDLFRRYYKEQTW